MRWRVCTLLAQERELRQRAHLALSVEDCLSGLEDGDARDILALCCAGEEAGAMLREGRPIVISHRASIVYSDCCAPVRLALARGEEVVDPVNVVCEIAAAERSGAGQRCTQLWASGDFAGQGLLG